MYRKRVVLRRSVNGMHMALNLPVAAFRGVAIRALGDGLIGAPSAIAMVLEHGDPALSLLLLPQRRATTSSPSGSAGAGCSACRC